MSDPTQEPRSDVQEAFIAVMSSLIAASDDPHPDITRRVCVYAIDNNDVVWQLWKAARGNTLEEAASVVEYLATCWSNLSPAQSKQIAAFFARNIRTLKDQK